MPISLYQSWLALDRPYIPTKISKFGELLQTDTTGLGGSQLQTKLFSKYTKSILCIFNLGFYVITVGEEKPDSLTMSLTLSAICTSSSRALEVCKKRADSSPTGAWYFSM